MKKLMITAVVTVLCGATMSYAQSTSSPTDKSQATKASGQGVKTPDNRYSEREDANSMLFSREAIAIRRKNLTEPDTVMKEGSGSSVKNMKNHTGVTGNYRNLSTQTSGTPSRE